MYWTEETKSTVPICDRNNFDSPIIGDNYECHHDSPASKVFRGEKIYPTEKKKNFSIINIHPNSLINCEDDSKNIPEKIHITMKNDLSNDVLKNVPGNVPLRNTGSRGRKQNILKQNSFLALTVPNSIPPVISKVQALCLSNARISAPAELSSALVESILSSSTSTSTSFSTLLLATSDPSDINTSVLDTNHNKNSKLYEGIESITGDIVEASHELWRSHNASLESSKKMNLPEKEKSKKGIDKKGGDDVVVIEEKEIEEKHIINNEESDMLKLKLKLDSSRKTDNRVIRFIRIIVIDAYALEKIKLKLWEIYLSYMIRNGEEEKREEKRRDIGDGILSTNSVDIRTKSRAIRSGKIVDLNLKINENSGKEVLRKSGRGTVTVCSNYGNENSDENDEVVSIGASEVFGEKNNSDVCNMSYGAERSRTKRNNKSNNNTDNITTSEGNENNCINTICDKENISNNVMMHNSQIKYENKINKKVIVSGALNDIDSIYDFQSITVSDRREYDEELPNCFMNRSRIMGNSTYKYVTKDGSACVEYSMNGVIGKGAFGYAILSNATSTYVRTDSSLRNKKQKDLELKFQTSSSAQTKGT